ncbi:MAG: RNA methyltransferase [Bacteroidales bacterium]|nr:RNA methyltransferase [Bacteroidales bacterium]
MTYRDLDIINKQKYYSLLYDIITEERKNTLESVIDLRTDRFIPVIENIHKAQNASAVLRTCDCLGIQEVRIVENNNKFSVTDDISLGANKWLNIRKYNSANSNLPNPMSDDKNPKSNIERCFDDLRAEGYKIIATMPHDNDINLQDIDITQKAAIVFGSEVDGISKEAIANADCFMKIPMFGFTESFNISVSAAITLHYLTNKLRNSDIDWHLSEEKRLDTLILWALQSITCRDKVEKELLSRVMNTK